MSSVLLRAGAPRLSKPFAGRVNFQNFLDAQGFEVHAR